MAEAENASSDTVGEEEDEQVEEAGDNQNNIASQVMKNPGVLAALQDKLYPGSETVSAYLDKLPQEVKRRIKALKRLQSDVITSEADFYKEVHALEVKYAPQYALLFDKRKDIVIGKKEPTDEECDWPSDEEEDEEKEADVNKLSGELKEKAKVGGGEAGGDAVKQTDVKGVPDFWLTILKNVSYTSAMIQEYDEPILRHLQDIKVTTHDKEPLGFTLEFHFAPNEYFTDTVLTKRYEMRYDPDALDPLSYEGPEIVKCTGCSISWNKGKNVTVKQVKKKQKHKGRGVTRTVTKQVQADSFFNFFNPPTVPEGSESEVDEDLEALLAADFDIGNMIRERIIPRAVLYFTGEALDDDYDDEDNEDVDEEEDEENDPDFKPETQDKPTECKQQ